MAEQVLQSGDHQVLLVPQPQSALARVLICAASGEPSKEDVLFAGRLVRHLGAETTLMTVLPETDNPSPARVRVERFLAGGLRTLELLGVLAQTVIRSGPVQQAILNEVTTGGYDLLVVGTPLSQHGGKFALTGIVGQLLNTLNCPTLLVRSNATQAI